MPLGSGDQPLVGLHRPDDQPVVHHGPFESRAVGARDPVQLVFDAAHGRRGFLLRVHLIEGSEPRIWSQGAH